MEKLQNEKEQIISSSQISQENKVFEEKFLELEMKLAKDLNLITERLRLAVTAEDQEKINDAMNEIYKFQEYYEQQDIEKFLQDPAYRKELIWLNAQIYKTQIPYLEDNKEAMKDISKSLYFLIKPIEQDIYKNPNNYIFSLTKDAQTEEFFNAEKACRSTDLFFILNTINKQGSGISNYRYLSEAAFLIGYPHDIFAGYGKSTETFRLINDLYENGSNKFKERVNTFFETELEHGNFDFFSEILINKYSTAIEAKIFEILNKYFKDEFNINKSAFAESLNYSDNLKESLSMNIMMMTFLEKTLPGSVNRLNEEYGIYEFGRYPESMLIDQIISEDSQTPYGLLVWPRDDHNQAFMHMGYDLDELYKDTKGKHLIRIFEAESKIDMAKILLKNNKKYGLENKISFLVLGGHGELESLNLGVDGTNRSKIDKTDFEGLGVQKIKDFFVKKPTIVLVSCSTGGDNGLIESVSKTYEAEVIAPKDSTMLNSIHVDYDKNQRPNFKVTFDGNVERRLISGKDVA